MTEPIFADDESAPAGTRRVLIRRGGGWPPTQDEWADVPAEVADQCDERLWHQRP